MVVVVLTALTLLAFAANSVLCRLALGGESIDPVSFTSIRLISGALVLMPVSRFAKETGEPGQASGSWRSGLALFAYAAAFSMAYISLSTGTGALILFGSVQVTMLIAAFRSGERMWLAQWVGFGVAVVGLVYLVSPGISAPNPIGAVLMAISGIAWGLYSIAGRGVSTPIAMTSGNFLWAASMTFVASALAFSQVHLEASGVILALVSGVLTSGFGYVLWYKTLPLISTTQASIVQLLVPVLAALGDVIFISEQITIRLAVASALILGGVAFSVLKNDPKAPTRRG